MMAPRRSDEPSSEWVVVVDDDEAAAVRTARHFNRAGLLAFPTSKGADVLLLVRTGRVAVVVVDTVLADMTGYQCVAHLKGIDPKLRLIVTSVKTEPGIEASARRMGIMHYAPKPLSLAKLTQVVSQALRHARRARGAGPGRP